MTLVNDKDSGRRRKSETGADEKGAKELQKKKKRGDVPAVGNALRSVYEETIREDIPPEMLDLLGKLG